MVKLVRLIGVGFVPAIPAQELQVGDRIIRNYRYIYRIIRLNPNKSGKSITFIIEGETKDAKGRILQKNFLNTIHISLISHISKIPLVILVLALLGVLVLVDLLQALSLPDWVGRGMILVDAFLVRRCMMDSLPK